MILLGNLEIVHAMPLCNFDVIVVTEFAVHVDLLMRTNQVSAGSCRDSHLVLFKGSWGNAKIYRV